MNQKKLNQYLKYMTSLSDKDREALYSKHEYRFSDEEVSRRLRAPLKKVDKSPYREIELSGWWNDVFAPQTTISNITNTPTKLYNGITVRRIEKKEIKMNIPFKGEIKRRWIMISSNNPSNLSNEILYNHIVNDMKNDGKEVTFEQVKKVAETWDKSFTSNN